MVPATRGPDYLTYLIWPPDLSRPRADGAQGCTAIAYETVTDAKGGCPCRPDDEVAGRLSIEAAGYALKRSAGAGPPFCSAVYRASYCRVV